MINGEVRRVLLPPTGGKDLDDKEAFVPAQIDLRNGVVTDAGNWSKRNGYTEFRDTTTEYPIDLLIGEGEGVAVTSEGSIYELTSTPKLLPTKLSGAYRPTWVKFNERIIYCDGGSPVYGNEPLGGNPPMARFVGRVGSYTLFAGYDPTEFTWSAANNPENTTTGDSGTTNVKKTGVIRYATDYRNKWLVFKDNEIEVWHNRGGSTPFVRLNELTIPRGLGSSYSVVKANQTVYWLDDDNKFRMLNGASAQLVSTPYENYFLDKLKGRTDIYGFNCELEHSIRWISPTNGISIRYDYENNIWSEDNHYEHGQFERLPFNSYMELDGKAYFGDYNCTGKVYEWSSDYKDDNGTEIRVLRDFKVKVSESGNRGTVNRLRLMLKRGVDTSTETNPELLVRWRFDEDPEDTEWNTETIGLGIGSDTQPYVDLYRLGIGRTIHIQIIENDAVSYLLTGAFITVAEKGI